MDDKIINHVPERLKGKNLSEVQKSTGLAYSIVHAWASGKFNRMDFKTLKVWCRYFQCQPGDLLQYIGGVPEK